MRVYCGVMCVGTILCFLCHSRTYFWTGFCAVLFGNVRCVLRSVINVIWSVILGVYLWGNDVFWCGGFARSGMGNRVFLEWVIGYFWTGFVVRFPRWTCAMDCFYDAQMCDILDWICVLCVMFVVWFMY